MKAYWEKLLGLGLGVALLISVHAGATTFYVNVSNAASVSPYTNWSKAATTIQDAIDVASDGDLIWVTNGVYASGGRVVYGSLTNRVVINKAVTVRSVNGPSVTAIRGYQVSSGSTAYTNDVRCVYMTNNAVLDGFTITNGSTLAASTNSTNVLCGGGVYCESTNAILTNCILTGNICQSQKGGESTGGGAVCQGTLYSCILSNNLVPTNSSSYGVAGGGAFYSVLNNCLVVSNSSWWGGGAAFCILNHCTVLGNQAPGNGSSAWGGGILFCTANNCLIAGNVAATNAGSGGGACWSALNYCILSNNVALSGGGIYLSTGSPKATPQQLNNCLVISNYCQNYGGGVYVDYGSSIPLVNCTIVGNTAIKQGGGVYYGALKNCIIYSNYSPSSSDVVYYFTILSNCRTNDPVFVNPAAGDFHLSSNSPCINAGNNAYISVTNDFDGNPRIVGGTVDIGAYEYQTPASVLSYTWAQQYGLPIDGTADYVDSDSDGMNNWQEWKAGTNPTNADSVLKLASLTNSIVGTKVTWQSVSGVTYYLQRGTNLAAQPPFTSLVSNLTGQAVSTSYTDSTATNATPYFYRIGVQ
ncbi:MAG: choice-of-anchor Q domain-containing protein [Verrucomicrobiota bacterium]